MLYFRPPRGCYCIAWARNHRCALFWILPLPFLCLYRLVHTSTHRTADRSSAVLGSSPLYECIQAALHWWLSLLVPLFGFYKQHGNIHLCRMASTPSCPLLWELTSMDSISRNACTLWLPAGELWQISRRRREPQSLFPCPPFYEITSTWLSPCMKGPFKVPTPQNSLPFWVL